ncbi:hypothetical protein ACFVHB_37305 [Kitasatospora sp. NPDC127111]
MAWASDEPDDETLDERRNAG